MPSTYTNELRLELQATGENVDTWGSKNNTVISLIEDAISGMVTVNTTGGTTTLTANNAASDEARMAMIKVTGTLVSAAEIVIPAKTKKYLVWNATSGAYSVTIKVSGGTGAVVAQGTKAEVFTDGTDTYIGVTDLTSGVNLPVSTGISGLGTGVATFLATPSSANLAAAVTDETGSGALVLAISPALTTPNLGTPSAATLTNATGLPLTTGVTGTLPVANGGTGVTTSTGTGNVVLSTSPSLTTPNLGTPSAATLTNATGLPLTTGVTGTLPVANGGTGVTTSTGTGNVVLSASPTLTGNPVAPTQTLGDSSTKIATTAFVASTAFSSALPAQTGNNGKFVTTDGANASWSYVPVATGISGLGTNVATALAVNVGSAGALVTNGGALGTPSSGTLTNATGLPLTTGVTGTLAVGNGGTGVATLTGLAKGNGTSAFSAASAGTDYVAPGSATTSGLTMATATMLGRNTAGSGAIEEIPLASQAEMEAGTEAGLRAMNPVRVKQAIDKLKATKGADIASAATVNLDTATGNLVHITGTTPITAITLASGASRDVVFDGALTLTHHATTLILPGGVNITTAAGDRATFRGDGSGNVRCIHYTKASGLPVVSPSAGAGDHYVAVHTGNGYGSTNTAIRRFTTTESSVGSAISYSDSATLGAAFTIQQPGIYAISYTDAAGGTSNRRFGVSVNSNQLTTAIQNITSANRLGFMSVGNTSASGEGTVTVVANLATNDVIRAHSGDVTNSDSLTRFTIRRIGNV